MPFVIFYRNSEIDGKVYLAGTSAEVPKDAADYLVEVGAAAPAVGGAAVQRVDKPALVSTQEKK